MNKEGFLEYFCLVGFSNFFCLDFKFSDLVGDGLICIHISLVLEDVKPLLHRLFVLAQCAFVLLKLIYYTT